METRLLATALVSFLNALAEAASGTAEEIEKLVSADGDDDAGEEKKPARKSRSKPAKDEDEDEKPARRSRAKAKAVKEDDDEDEDEDEDEDDDAADDEPSEDDVSDAVKAALKVLERTEVSKLIKKFGKADKSREVKPENRRHLIVNLEKAVKNADE